MEHSYIEEHNIADRYLLGKLSAQERMRFEERLENCVQCVNLPEVIGGLRTGLQIPGRNPKASAPDMGESPTLTTRERKLSGSIIILSLAILAPIQIAKAGFTL